MHTLSIKTRGTKWLACLKSIKSDNLVENTRWLEKKQIIEKRVDEAFWFQLIFTSTGRHGLGLKVSISVETFDFLNQCWFYQYWIKKINLLTKLVTSKTITIRPSSNWNQGEDCL